MAKNVKKDKTAKAVKSELVTPELNDLHRTRIKTLFTKQKALLGNYYKAVEFKQPCVLLMRRSGDVEFYEDCKKAVFTFNSSDDEVREIRLLPQRQMKFTFIDRSFRGYICHEDFPFPLPENPLLSMEEFTIAQEKTLNDIRAWKTKELNAKTNLIKTIGWVIVGLIGCYILYKMVIVRPADAPAAAQAMVDVANHTIKNITAISQGATILN